MGIGYDGRMLGTFLSLFLFFENALVAAPKLELIRAIPHDGYSEGIDFYGGYLWAAFPKKILKIDPRDGKKLGEYPPPSEYSESLMWFRGLLWNVSYTNNKIYAGKLNGSRLDFAMKGTVPEKHAWGITHNEKEIIVTGNYSRNLYFLDPADLTVTKTLSTPVKDLEDLAWDGLGIWASSFSEYRGHIFRIDPTSGSLQGLFELSDAKACPIIDGIAYDGEGLWVTGKNCPAYYYFRRPRELEKVAAAS